MTNTNEKRLLKRTEVEKETTLSCSAIYALMAKGLFPRPIKLSPRSVAWSSDDVNEWIDAKMGKKLTAQTGSKLLANINAHEEGA